MCVVTTGNFIFILVYLNYKTSLAAIIAITLLIFFYYRKKRESSLTVIPGRQLPVGDRPSQPAGNDKLVLVKNCSLFELKKAIGDFCRLYNTDSYLVLPRLIPLEQGEYAILFPYDTDFGMFCFVVNYLYYPINIEKHFQVTGWTTLGDDEAGIPKEAVGHRAMLFIPEEDREGDNVFMTTENQKGYKIDFSFRKKNKALDSPKKPFTEPAIDIHELGKLPYEDFA